MEVKFSKRKPPVYEECSKRFGIKWEDGVAFTYGNTIHCKETPSEDLIVHEMVHIEQQAKIGKELWWKRYFDEPVFRLEQEVEAYRKQLQFINERYNRFTRRLMFIKIVEYLTTMYGGICSRKDAVRMLS